MRISLKKTTDGVVLACTRPDGAAVVQRTGHGGFFALHDLMHFAVETTLGIRNAFFGLVAQGWDFGTFGDHGDPRYQSMPDEAIFAEHLVDIITRGFSDSVWLDPDLVALWAEDVNRELTAALSRNGRTARRIEADPPACVCRCFRDLANRWAEVPVGGQLALEFAPAVQPTGYQRITPPADPESHVDEPHTPPPARSVRRDVLLRSTAGAGDAQRRAGASGPRARGHRGVHR